MTQFSFSYASSDDDHAQVNMSFKANNVEDIMAQFEGFLNAAGYFLPEKEGDDDDDYERRLTVAERPLDPESWDWDDDDNAVVKEDGRGGITPFAHYCEEHPEEPECRIYEL